MLLIKNCALLSMGPAGDGDMDILTDGGKIVRVGPGVEPPAGCEVLDAAGRVVTPGLVEPHCHLGLSPLSGQNINEKTGPAQAGLRAIDAVDLDSTDFTRALRTGVTTLVTGPGSSNLIGGVFMAVKSAGDGPAGRVLREEALLKMALGENPKLNYGRMNRSPATRMGAVAVIREELYKARAYREKWLASQRGEGELKFDLHLHSLMRAFDGMRTKIHAHEADDILSAIRVAREFQIPISIDHCTAGMFVLPELREAGYPVIIGPVAGGKSKVELAHKSYALAAMLEQAGIRFAITTDSGVIPMEGLLMQAALLVKHGLSRKGALRALTIDAAWATDLDGRVGSIEPGKDADIVIWDMHPLDTMARPDVVLIDGKIRLTEGRVVA